MPMSPCGDVLFRHLISTSSHTPSFIHTTVNSSHLHFNQPRCANHVLFNHLKDVFILFFCVNYHDFIVQLLLLFVFFSCPCKAFVAKFFVLVLFLTFLSHIHEFDMTAVSESIFIIQIWRLYFRCIIIQTFRILLLSHAVWCQFVYDNAHEIQENQ